MTADLPVTVVDDDRGIVLSPTSLSVGRGGRYGGVTYTVKLATQPSPRPSPSRSPGTRARTLTLDKASLTFTTGNWDTAQTVTVKAVQDADGADDSVDPDPHGNRRRTTPQSRLTLPVTVVDDETGHRWSSLRRPSSVDEGDADGGGPTR